MNHRELSRKPPMNTSDAFPVRTLAADLSAGFPLRWHGGNAFRAHFFNALSMSFPVGEQSFIDSVQMAAKLLPDVPERVAPGTRGGLSHAAAQQSIISL